MSAENTNSLTLEKKPMNELDFGSDSDEEVKEETEKEEVINKSVKKVVPKKKFMDEDEESDDDTNTNVKTVQPKIINKVKKNHSIIGDKPLTDYIFANVDHYSFKTWQQCFPDNQVNLRSLIFNPGWNEFFDIVEKRPYYKGMERILSNIITKNQETIIPHAELVFNAFNILSPKQIKIVIIGQDPYPSATKINGKLIPEAMGVSFSVPLNYAKPMSLANIYKNLLDFKHIEKIPTTGCLAPWILQGCFMINAALTTVFTKKNAHKEIWKNFTNDLLAYLDSKCKNIVFDIWGKDAHLLCQNIDPIKHHIITSSHPSPLGCNQIFSGVTYGKGKNYKDKKKVVYPSFITTDHFGRINSYLKSVNKREIFWDLINN